MARDSFRQGRALLLAAWLGAGVFLAAVIAPGAFAVLPTSELAGRVVGRGLTALNLSGLLLGALLAIFATRETGGASWGRAGWIERGAGLVLLLATASTEFVINRRIASLRLTHEIASLAPDDPARAEFGALHGLSVIVFAAALVAALVALLAIVRRAGENQSSSNG